MLIHCRAPLGALLVVAFVRTAAADPDDSPPIPDPGPPPPDPPLVLPDEPPAPVDTCTILPSPAPPVIDAHSVAPTTAERHRGEGTFMIGAGFSPDDHFIARSAVEHPNLFHTGQRLLLSAEVSERQQRFLLEHDLPNVVPGLDLQTQLFSTRRAYPGFTREGAGGAVTLSHRLDASTRIYGRYRIEHVAMDFPDTEATAKPTEMVSSGDGIVATLGAGIVHDTLDEHFIPRRGSRYELYTERAARSLGSDYDFQRTGASLDHARSLGPFTLRLHGQAGYIHTSDPLGVPLSERFQHDGHADVRGYALDSVASTGSNLEALGRIELELPVWKRAGISIAGWADAGLRLNTDPMWGPTDNPLVQRSVGLSLIWRSPLGPLRFDFAVPLDGKSRDRQFLFGLGGYF